MLPESRSYSRALAGILGAAFLARVLVVAAVPTRPVSDFLEYFPAGEPAGPDGTLRVALFIANNPRADGGWDPNWVAELERLRPGDLRAGTARRGRRPRRRPVAGPERILCRPALRQEAPAARDERLDRRGLRDLRRGNRASGLPGARSARTPSGQDARRAGAACASVLGIAARGGGRGRSSSPSARGPSRIPRTAVLAVGFSAAALYIPLLSTAIAVNGRYRWTSSGLSPGCSCR